MAKDGISIRRKAGKWLNDKYTPYRVSSRLNFVTQEALEKALELVHSHVVASTKMNAYLTGLLANSMVYCVQGGTIQGLNSAGGGAKVDPEKYSSVVNFPKNKVKGRVTGFVGTFVSHSMEQGSKSDNTYQYAAIVEYGGVINKNGEEMVYFKKDGSETVVGKYRIYPHSYFRIGVINAMNDPRVKEILREEVVRGLTTEVQ